MDAHAEADDVAAMFLAREKLYTHFGGRSNEHLHRSPVVHSIRSASTAWVLSGVTSHLEVTEPQPPAHLLHSPVPALPGKFQKSHACCSSMFSHSLYFPMMLLACEYAKQTMIYKVVGYPHGF